MSTKRKATDNSLDDTAFDNNIIESKIQKISGGSSDMQKAFSMKSMFLSQEDDDDDNISMQAMLEHLKKVSQKKSSKTKEKLQHSVENTFEKVERILVDSMEEEAARNKRSLTNVASEFSRLQVFLRKWSKEVHTANETYCTAMKKLGDQMNHAVNSSLQKMETSLKEMAVINHKEKQQRVMDEIHQAVGALKSEINSKPQGSGGMGAKALPLLMQALMSQDM